MFEFLLALFGGVYYYGKYANEKYNSKKAEDDIQKMISDMRRDEERWMRTVVDIKLEHDIKHSISGLQDMRLRIRNEANVECVTNDMAIMGLLAQKAKIPKHIADTGIHSRGIWDYAEQKMWQEQRKFLLWYDKELRRNGLQEPLLFIDGVNAIHVSQNMSLAKPITETSRMIGGHYFWAPIRIHIH